MPQWSWPFGSRADARPNVWPFLLASHGSQVREYVDKCHPCLTLKAKQPRAPLENIVATHPLELVHLDYLCLEPGKEKRGKHPGGDRPLHLLCPGVCQPIIHCPNNSWGPLWQFYCSLGDTRQDPLRSREKFWKWVDSWHLQANGDPETQN